MTRFAIRVSEQEAQDLTLGHRDRARVAMISGTYVLTDSIKPGFDKIFTDICKGTTP